MGEQTKKRPVYLQKAQDFCRLGVMVLAIPILNSAVNWIAILQHANCCYQPPPQAQSRLRVRLSDSLRLVSQFIVGDLPLISDRCIGFCIKKFFVIAAGGHFLEFHHIFQRIMNILSEKKLVVTRKNGTRIAMSTFQLATPSSNNVTSSCDRWRLTIQQLSL